MTRQEWWDSTMKNGTSGDQVHDILMDWEKAEKELDWYKTGARFAFVAAGGVGVSEKAVEKWVLDAPKDFKLQDKK